MIIENRVGKRYDLNLQMDCVRLAIYVEDEILRLRDVSSDPYDEQFIPFRVVEE